MGRSRLQQALIVVVLLVVCLLPVSLARSQAPAPACNLYPIALHLPSLAEVAPGTEVPNILHGSQPGNVGWLAWTDNTNAGALATSLTVPGDSHTYVNPTNSSDRTISVGDWIRGGPGAIDSSAVRAALDTLKAVDIVVPVWDLAEGQGAGARYRVAAFARVRVTDYQLAAQSRISARFLGYATCDVMPSTPTSTITATTTTTSSPTLTSSPTATNTPTVTVTATGSPTPTRTATVGATPTATLVTPTSTPTLMPGTRDADNDGYPASQDCNDNDPTIHPGATDKPDLALVDRNCDGIDGDRAAAIFVSPAGNDTNAGTPAAPKRTISAAILAAAGTKDVYIAAGIYDEGSGVMLASNVSLYGGYEPTSWSRSLTAATIIAGAPQAVLADGAVNVTLQLLALRGSAHADRGRSVYGLRAINNANVTLERTSTAAADALAGAAGTSAPTGPAANGGSGQAGRPGAEHSEGFCATASRPLGGMGGSSAAGRPGGRGGDAGHGEASGGNGEPGGGGTPGGPGTPPGQGNWSTPPQYWGRDGASGAPGAHGAPGTAGFGTLYTPQDGGSGAAGQPGNGGGGGGGGGGGTENCDSYGGSGGGGGGGGAGGAAGTGGGSGGGSFGVYLWNSAIQVRDQSSLAAGNGGAGGDGGTGQPGGSGGLGGPQNPYGGSGEQDDGSNGGRGGGGGHGGGGGAGGGGAGGPSYGLYGAGTSTASVAPDTTFTIGVGGAGGSSPAGAGSSGPSGAAANTAP